MSEKIYFPNLNSFRFLAAAIVLIHHVELFLIENNSLESYSTGITKGGGQYGVTFFFVLSGFLITYLLFRENELSSTISVKNFYLRRILRIWPLYYLILVLGFFVFPRFSFIYKDLYGILNYDFNGKLLEYVFFIPNYTLAKLNQVPFASHLWSIGVEEQFYLIWPLLIKFSRKKIKLFLIILLTMMILKSIFYVTNFYNYSHYSLDYLRSFLRLSRFECMAIGGIAAYVLFNNNRNILKFIFRRNIQFMLFILTSILMLNDINIPLLHNYIYSILFSVIILNASANNNRIINLENRILNYLGKISFGLYMYHPICIAISYCIFKNIFQLNKEIDFINKLIIVVLTFIITIIISAISYNFFEKKILDLKPYFTKKSS